MQSMKLRGKNFFSRRHFLEKRFAAGGPRPKTSCILARIPSNSAKPTTVPAAAATTMCILAA